ncbi:pH-response regulator protein palA/rim20 [Malassezia yamatoensis]|uniref:PH-response regulator protein palA/rim20 n=1 Tax=Malassezia yamatoensis TaxID=253288 RepID=A0AAJ6CGJ6_9BASI|nr:pH-response regulator protein palA/rim20 [Malassezia yamatoensis]
MSNVLGIGIPRTDTVVLREGVHAFLNAAFPEVQADVFDEDIDSWSSLREECIYLSVSSSSIPILTRYVAQLAFILRVFYDNAGSKDASNVRLTFGFPWASGLSNAYQTLYHSIFVERACFVQCIAAQFAELGSKETRSNKTSIRDAITHFQYAAGSLSVLASVANAEVQNSQPPDELLSSSIEALKYLMLAQAQECVWQKATQDGLKDTSIAKLARSTADLYHRSAELASSSKLPTSYKTHTRFKQLHFYAAAQYRKSCDDLIHKRYGDELGRLTLASQAIKKALALPTRTLSCSVLVEDLNGLKSIVETNLSRAERDNQLIYLESITSETSLPDIGVAVMAQEVIPEGLASPLAQVHKQDRCFGRLLLYGIDVAERIYCDKKQMFLESNIEPQLEAMEQEAHRICDRFDLPRSLDRIESPRRFPTEWTTYSSQLRRLPLSVLLKDMEKVKHLAISCNDLLVSLDGELFKAYPGLDNDLVSQQHDLQILWRDYQATLSEAGASDSSVLEQWNDIRPDLEAIERGRDAVAELLMPQTSRMERERRNMAPQLRSVRAEYEKLQDFASKNRSFLLKVRTACNNDDLRSQLVHANREQQVENNEMQPVDPGSLQPVLERAMQKYTPYIQECDNMRKMQSILLASLGEKYKTLFSNAGIQAAIQAQDAVFARIHSSFEAFTVLVKHVQDGSQFYNRLHALLLDFCADVHQWSQQANQPRFGEFPGGKIQFRD